MPMITVTLAATPAPELTKHVVTTIGELTARILRKDPKVTAIAVRYHDPADWYVGGHSLAVQKTAGYWLDIKVTDATNTKDEVAAYLKAVHTALGAIMGGVHDESYTLVDEVPAHDYGYGGETQEQRFIAGRLAQN